MVDLVELRARAERVLGLDRPTEESRALIRADLLALADEVELLRSSLGAMRTYLVRSLGPDLSMDEGCGLLMDLDPEDGEIVARWAKAMDPWSPEFGGLPDLFAIIDNDQGRGEGPSPRWFWSSAAHGWTRVDQHADGSLNERSIKLVGKPHVWSFWLNGEPRPDLCPDSPTARGGMKASDLLLL